jgi:hypothetical protein
MPRWLTWGSAQETPEGFKVETKYGTSDRTTHGAPNPPSPDVVERQDSEHSEADFLHDLSRATQRKPS